MLQFSYMTSEMGSIFIESQARIPKNLYEARLIEVFRALQLGQAGGNRQDGSLITPRYVIGAFSRDVLERRTNRKLSGLGDGPIPEGQALTDFLSKNAVPYPIAIEIGILWGEAYREHRDWVLEEASLST